MMRLSAICGRVAVLMCLAGCRDTRSEHIPVATKRVTAPTPASAERTRVKPAVPQLGEWVMLEHGFLLPIVSGLDRDLGLANASAQNGAVSAAQAALRQAEQRLRGTLQARPGLNPREVRQAADSVEDARDLLRHAAERINDAAVTGPSVGTLRTAQRAYWEHFCTEDDRTQLRERLGRELTRLEDACEDPAFKLDPHLRRVLALDALWRLAYARPHLYRATRQLEQLDERLKKPTLCRRVRKLTAKLKRHYRIQP